MNWDQIVQKLEPYIVKIETPDGSGTGFLCVYNEEKTWCGIATALHVVDGANDWQQPIKIHHTSSGKNSFLKEGQRVIFTDLKTDSAVILFEKGDLPFPEQLIPLLPSDRKIALGCEVGWMGFPAIEPWTLCFFSGNVSARQDHRNAYLIDGVAINGVSGGPVAYSDGTDGVQIVGTVSAYKANRSTGDALPGLLIAQDVSHFHDVAKHIRTIDDARDKKDVLEDEQQPDPSEGRKKPSHKTKQSEQGVAEQLPPAVES
jgi:hypothetical protein